MSRSTNVRPADIDAMLHDVSNQMARSQLFRRLSANSNTSSPSSKRGNARVVKAQGSGGSPHGVQRRRTTAAHSARNKPQITKPVPSSQQLPQTARACPLSAARPMTWHPGWYPLANCPQEFTPDGFMASDQSTTFQESSFTDYSYCPPYVSFDSTLPLAPAQQDASFNPPSRPTISGYPHDYSGSASLYQPTPYEYATPSLYQDVADLYDCNQLASGFQNADLYPIPSDHASHSAQQTPTLFSNQYTYNAPAYVQSSEPPQITKQRSKELVGMGLYDGPGRKELLTLNSSPDHIDLLFTPPQGKGLKLEETWQPPNDDGDEVEEEGSSEDEGEEIPPPASSQTDLQSTFIPAYGDLSNQSFFFDSDDPYPDYLPLDQGFQACQPKATDPSLQNFMWF